MSTYLFAIVNGPYAGREQGWSANDGPVWQYMQEWTIVGVLKVFQNGHQLLREVCSKFGDCIVEMDRVDECERGYHPRVQSESLVILMARQQTQLSHSIAL